MTFWQFAAEHPTQLFTLCCLALAALGLLTKGSFPATMSAHDTCPACGKHEAHASKVFDLLDEAKRTERERIIGLLNNPNELLSKVRFTGEPDRKGWLSENELAEFFKP